MDFNAKRSQKVKERRTMSLEDTGINGRPFNVYSASVNGVLQVSSSNIRLPTSDSIIIRTNPMKCSQDQILRPVCRGRSATGSRVSRFYVLRDLL